MELQQSLERLTEPGNGVMSLRQFERLCERARVAYRAGELDWRFSDVVQGIADLAVRRKAMSADQAYGLASMWVAATDAELEKQLQDSEQARRVKDIRLADLRDRPRPRYLLGGMIPEESLVVLYGAPGCGKSFMAIDWALCVQAGIPWRLRPRESVRKGQVVYMAFEGQGGLRDRVRAWEAVNEGNADEARFVEEHFWDYGDRFVGGTVAMLEYLRCLPDRPAFIVIDTLARAMIGADENKANEVSIFLRCLDAMRKRTRATILLVHHASKGGDVRGSTALKGAADVVLRLYVTDADINTLKSEKVKDGMDIEPVKFWLRSTEAEGMFYDSAVVAPHIQGVKGHIAKEMRRNCWYTVKELGKRVDSDSENFTRRCLLELQALGIVKYRNDGRWGLV